MRRAIVLAGTLLAVLTPAALAQGPVVPPEPEAIATPDDQEPEAAATPEACEERGPGTDGDYAYCPDDYCESDDADYAYAPDCVYSSAEPTGTPKAARRAPAAAVQPLATRQTLPMTGGEPWLIAAAGAGMLLLGSGLRLRGRHPA